ncbi:MAG: hypothetical protein PHU85_03360, partial [Phycisphaerae bacterium]|nr:hypothetical protein [Phycisphaerae bacterium]
MGHPRVGLLPLYIKLYDTAAPEAREKFTPFLAEVEAGLAAAGLVVERAPICCVAAEFDAAVADLEKRGVDLLIALHLAYSPSLESVPALTRTTLPLLLLDTTMDSDFGQAVNPDRIMYNHGIHGVQDLACMLRRNERPFEIVAGHLRLSDVLGSAGQIARAARAAKKLRGLRALRISGPFVGMGDFAVEDHVLADRLGVNVTKIKTSELGDSVRAVTD